MVTQAPKRSALFTVIAFTLSCLGLMLFVWTQFGGTIPFSARSYRVQAVFPETGLLVPGADVRIAGIHIGRVEAVAPRGVSSLVSINVDPQYAPLPADTSAILREKTLLGEAFVMLSRGTPSGPKLADGGTIPAAHIQATQQLDHVVGSFDQPTQRALQDLLNGTFTGLSGRGSDLNDALGNLSPALGELGGVVGVLNDQGGHVRGVINNLAVVLGTVGSRSADLRSLVTAGDQVLSATASRDAQLTATVNALPPFMTQLRRTLLTLDTTLGIARPTLAALTPVAPLLLPALNEVVQLSGPAIRLLHQAPSLLRAARKALPAIGRFSAALRPAVDVLLPAVRQVAPTIDTISLYPKEITAAMGNLAGFLNARAPASNGITRYLRTTFALNSESLFGQAQRPPTNRHNAYLAPGGLTAVAHGLPSSDCGNLQNKAPVTLLPLGSGNVPCVLQPQFPWPRTVSPSLTPSYFPHVTARRP